MPARADRSSSWIMPALPTARTAHAAGVGGYPARKVRRREKQG